MSNQEQAQEVKEDPRFERHVDIYFTGPNASGKTMMAAAMMDSLSRLGVKDITFINPEHSRDQVERLREIASQIIAEKLTDVKVTVHELFGSVRVVQTNAINEVERALKAALHYIETPGDFTEEERLAVIEDITGILPEEPQ